MVLPGNWKHLRFIFGLVLIVFPGITGFGQQYDSEFDRLYKEGLGKTSSDIRAAEQYLNSLTAYQKELTPLQKAKINYLRLRIIYSNQEQVESLETNILKVPDSLGYEDALIYSAHRFLEKSMPDRAIPLLMKAIDSLKDVPDKTVFCNISLCEAYRQKQEYVKGLDMLNEILYTKKPVSDINRAYAYNRLAAIYNEQGSIKINPGDSVIKYSELGIALSDKIGSKSNLGTSRNELSYQYFLKKQYDKALDLSVNAVRNFKEAGMMYSAMNALINQSNIYIGLNELKLALQAVDEATGLCKIEENRNLYMRLYLQFANISNSLGNYKEAFDFQEICRLLQVDFFRDRINVQINEQSARYDLLIKEQKIREEKQKNEFHKKQIAFLVVILAILFVAFISSFFYLKLKRKEFLKQKLIEAVIETEASERKRIARDLHDGLGPVLSAINHYFQAYIDADAAGKESIQTKLHQVISGAIDEVSRISHNISPYVLENHGLHTALNNFIAPLANTGKIKIEYTSDFIERFESNKELTVYRCITELLNNTMKHADASRITIDIKSREKVLDVFYTDDGKGFDLNLSNTEGMGLFNIKNRVETFGGKLAIDSSMKNGIRVNIEIPL
jgi:signal transduction histidine kinase